MKKGLPSFCQNSRSYFARLEEVKRQGYWCWRACVLCMFALPGVWCQITLYIVVRCLSSSLLALVWYDILSSPIPLLSTTSTSSPLYLPRLSSVSPARFGSALVLFPSSSYPRFPSASASPCLSQQEQGQNVSEEKVLWKNRSPKKPYNNN